MSRTRVAPLCPRNFEEVAQLSIGQLHQQRAQKLTAFFTDGWISQRAGQRSRKVADAGGRILPHRRIRPLVMVHAGDGVRVEERRAAERQADVVEHHQGVRAGATRVDAGVEADEALLFAFGVGVLQEHRKKLQGVALRARGAAGSFVNQIQFRPRPPASVWSGQLDAGPPLDGRRLDDTFTVRTLLSDRVRAPRQMTRTGYMRSAPNPSAHSSRVAATSP